jgi:hypothetical protein
MASFSLTEKLAVTGAFLAVVALLVGTEDDPGLVIDGQEAVKELRPAAAAPAPLAQAAPPASASGATPAPAETPPLDAAAPAPTAPTTPVEDQDDDKQFSPELGRVPLDFSKGPPAT